MRPEDAELTLPSLSYAESYLAARLEGYRDGSEDAAGPEIAPDRLAEHIAPG